MNKEITVDELKKIQLEILDVVDAFCKEHNLRYYLAYGTLIGAIRHHGYIPWDDDVDIAMPRSDYDILIEHFNDYNKNYKVKCPSSDKNLPMPLAKVYDNRTKLIENVSSTFEMGVNIDVFPIDGLSSDISTATKNVKAILRFNKFLALKVVNLSKNRIWYKNVILLVGKIFLCFNSISKIISKIENIAKRYTFEQSNYVGHIVAPYGVNEILDKKIFEDVIKVEFEGNKYNAPKWYDEYLTKIYGNYMQYPPKEQQVAHHSFKAYWK